MAGLGKPQLAGAPGKGREFRGARSAGKGRRSKVGLEEKGCSTRREMAMASKRNELGRVPGAASKKVLAMASKQNELHALHTSAIVLPVSTY